MATVGPGPEDRRKLYEWRDKIRQLPAVERGLLVEAEKAHIRRDDAAVDELVTALDNLGSPSGPALIDELRELRR